MKKIEECGAFELSGNVESRDTKTRGNFRHHIDLESNKVSVRCREECKQESHIQPQWADD